MNISDPVLSHFLNPGYALDAASQRQWSASGVADTPGADARCRIVLARNDGNLLCAAFSAFGPPEVVACADWVCERVSGAPIETAEALGIVEVEKALALAPAQRYAGVIAVDALRHAMITLVKIEL